MSIPESADASAEASPRAFPIDLQPTTELLDRFHRTLMDRRNHPEWETFDVSQYDPALVEHARVQWAGRAVAEYQSTAQFASLLHQLTLVGAPVSLIGAATRLAQDECRHAELCAEMAELLGGRQGLDVTPEGLDLYPDERDPWFRIYRTILSVCCFGEALSIPMLYSLELVATDPVPETIARTIAADEEYHARFGWEALDWLTPQLSDAQRAFIQERLSLLMAHFEGICGGSAEMLDRLAGEDVDIEEGDPDHPNLGTLTDIQYAAIFYHTVEAQLLPNLSLLGYDAMDAWARRPG